jgi:hypothetical protein
MTQPRKKGHWQKDIPKKPGLYWTATKDGFLCTPKTVVFVCGEWHSTDRLASNCEWGGWWWSIPLPQPPKPPAWTE